MKAALEIREPSKEVVEPEGVEEVGRAELKRLRRVASMLIFVAEEMLVVKNSLSKIRICSATKTASKYLRSLLVGLI
jgi:hypothetical protein